MSSLMRRFVNSLKNPDGAEIIESDNAECVKMPQLIEGTNTLANVFFIFEDGHAQVTITLENVFFRNINYEVLKSINQFNREYRPFKFFIYEHNALMIRYDIINADDKIDELIPYALIGIDVIEKIHPEIMRLMWL